MFNKNMKLFCEFVLIIILSVVFVNHITLSQDIPSKSQNLICSRATNCSLCVSSHPSCAWCSSKSLNPSSHRCESLEYLKNNGCPQEEIVSPQSSIEILKDETHAKAAVQLRPQHIRLRVRKNDIQRFTINFEQAQNYPIDLYYLMDLTFSMKEHKEQLALLADTLAENMFNITENFRLGFGSFIDKVAMPYTNMVPQKLENPCLDSIQCVRPYGFKNHLPLTDDISKFSSEVESTPLSGNLDNAEGGFDAIMQVLVCKDYINWGHLSRKFILFATDSPFLFHYAGDGKLGGIIEKNDGKCHLNDDGIYTESVNQDYPSLEQINHAVTNSKTNIIFAVPNESIGIYRQLSEHLPGSTTGVLADDSSNIVDLIRDNFQKIASKVELSHSSQSNLVELRYMSSCLHNNSKYETNVCDNVGTGKSISFDVELKVINCSSTNKEIFTISPIGIDEYIVVELEVICECDCESESIAIAESPDCSGNGTYACGVCNCDHNRLGKTCECDGDDVNRQDMNDKCKKDNTSDILCTGRGDCVCGQCYCRSDTISGDFCECDTFSCPRHSNGLVCGGDSRGVCCDGECTCYPDWSGPACQCSESNSTCANPEDSSLLCSGRGECVCGRCSCVDEYYGQYCQDCAKCEGRCNELQHCVDCKVFNGGTFSPVECRDKCTFTYDIVQSLDSQPKDRECIYVDVDGCSINFVYNYKNENDLHLRVLEERQCQQMENVYYAVGSIALSIFLIGLIALLIFKLIIWWKDKKEYEKWLAEATKTRTLMSSTTEDQNPLFISPKQEFINPTYKSSKME